MVLRLHLVLGAVLGTNPSHVRIGNDHPANETVAILQLEWYRKAG